MHSSVVTVKHELFVSFFKNNSNCKIHHMNVRNLSFSGNQKWEFKKSKNYFLTKYRKQEIEKQAAPFLKFLSHWTWISGSTQGYSGKVFRISNIFRIYSENKGFW